MPVRARHRIRKHGADQSRAGERNGPARTSQRSFAQGVATANGLRTADTSPGSQGLLHPDSVVNLQRKAGNQATSRIVVQRYGELGRWVAELRENQPEIEVPSVALLVLRDAPLLMACMPDGAIEALQRRLEITARNEQLQAHLNELRRRFAARYGGLNPEGVGVVRKEINSIRSRMRKVGGPTEIAIQGKDLLAISPDMVVEPMKDIVPTLRFRKAVFDAFEGQPVKVRVQGEGADAKIVLHWLFASRSHAGGLVTLQHLIARGRGGWGFGPQYDDLVRNAPERTDLLDALKELRDVMFEVYGLHQSRSDSNREQPIVRRVAEWFGGPSEVDHIRLWMDVQKNPEKGSYIERFGEINATYPRLSIWDTPRQHVIEAQTAIHQSGIEIGAIALQRAELSVVAAIERFGRYEDRVTKGAGSAIKWLGRAKVAGQIAASVLAGPKGYGLSTGASALAAGGYVLAQEGSQQASELYHDQRESIDVAGLAAKAGSATVMSFFGNMTSGAFEKALTARFGARLTELAGPQAATLALKSAAAGTSQFYEAPAKAVLNRILAGDPLPGSLEEFADLIAKEAATEYAGQMLSGGMTGSKAFDVVSPPAEKAPSAK